MISSFGDEFDQPGTLRGMKGTTPMAPLTDDFKNRLRSVDPNLGDFVYSGETYDAVVMSAIAAELAGSTAPAAIAAQLIGVTSGGTPCDTVKTCLSLAASGTDLVYSGVSMSSGGFTDVGEPSVASFATLHFDAQDQLDAGKMEFVTAGDETQASTRTAPPGARPANAAASGAPLKIGGLLPETGDLKLAYPPMAAGAALAIREVNAAGGVLGEDVVFIKGDDGTSPEVAKATVASHISAGVHVILGAGASGVSTAVLPQVKAAGLILFSPCNTAASLTGADDAGLYFRTAPPDVMQGAALGDVILRDGPKRIAIVARDDEYGSGLEENVRAALDRSGVTSDNLLALTYDHSAETIDFSGGAEQIKEFGPDALVLIGFAESADVIKALLSAGVEFKH
ncbi:ABC-type branched-subunit amino acid transport system substrate-binding protein [Catenuloplanes atrovinosus]|uniref:ABC-type branched-subunit amino acid transport system substrate-binding protein n=2 Tax=Catenuloplanes atrovinosus TaxID=137266 RepID=A0AAE3YX37_9ACTN|nr:ABC-type branched-subunit amino acid transport system substrate-binding protein [Catenuloplanes atrovinosus]